MKRKLQLSKWKKIIDRIIIAFVVIATFLTFLYIVSFLLAERHGPRSPDATRISDIRQLELALELYVDDHFDDHIKYPTALSALTPRYISEIPRDPKTDEPYKYELLGTESYCLGAILEDKQHPSALHECEFESVDAREYNHRVGP